MERALHVIKVTDTKIYEAFTLPQLLLPNLDIDNRTLIMYMPIQIVIFNDGLVQLIRPN